MKMINRCLVILIAIAIGLVAVTGCSTAEPYSTSATETETTETTKPSTETESIEETEEVKKDLVSVVIYNPKSNFIVSSEDKESTLDIKNNQLSNGVASNLFYIGSTYTMNIEEDIDTITFTGDSEQGKDTKYSIKDSFTTVSISGNTNKATLSLKNKEAIVEEVNGEIKYEAIDILENSKVYILDIQIKTSENSIVTIRYNESKNNYIITSTGTVTEVHTTYKGFSEAEGTGAVTVEEGTTFVVSIDNDNMVHVEKTK